MTDVMSVLKSNLLHMTLHAFAEFSTVEQCR